MNRLVIPDDIVGLVRSLHPDLKKKIRAGLQAIVDDPLSGKALKEELTGLRSLRVSRFRIVYRLAQTRQIEIVAIGPRQRIYDETARFHRKTYTEPTGQ